MQPDRTRNRVWLASPAVTLAVVLAAALGLAFVPRSKTEPLRDGWREALRPGLQMLTMIVDWAEDRWTSNHHGDAANSTEAEKQIAQLNEQVQRLQMAFLVTSSNRDSASAGGVASEENGVDGQMNRRSLPPLLLSQSIPARVLGRQAKAFLQAREILDVGKSRGAASDSLVVDSGPKGIAPRSGTQPSQSDHTIGLVDQGRDSAVETGRLVLAGSRVWGKVAEVGLHTSTVQRVTDVGYRDLVQLASLHNGRLRFAARGVLVGHGESLCKIELVETTQPVTAGDLVFTADDGVLDVPLLYGRVVRLERKPGAAHWEIWMESAAPVNSPPSQVAVLRMELNPARLASGQ
jgi:cell shape-determining protein MreC